MKEAVGDLWTVDCEYRCVTTNGVVRPNGELVMGKGVALQAKERFPDLPFKLGELVRVHGNRPFRLSREGIITFPTKHHWKHLSDLTLIENSARLIVAICDKFDIKSVAMTRPGCGNGWLRWEEVKGVIEPYFDDRFLVISND